MILNALAPPALAIPLLLAAVSALPAGFTIEQILSAPFESASGGAPYTARPLTHYQADDGLRSSMQS